MNRVNFLLFCDVRRAAVVFFIGGIGKIGRNRLGLGACRRFRVFRVGLFFVNIGDSVACSPNWFIRQHWENTRARPDANTARAICQQCATRSGTTAMVFLMCALAALGGGVRGCVYVCTQTTHE